MTTCAVDIRNDFITGLYTRSFLARKYGVHRDTIRHVLNRSEDKDVYTRKPSNGNYLMKPYEDVVRDWLKRQDMPSIAVYYRLLDFGAQLSMSTVEKAVAKIKKELDITAIAVETEPGQQAQADWTDFRGYTANRDGVEKPLHAFFLILGYSRQKFVEFTTEMTTKSLINCIEHALQYYGGCPREILFDNMPQVVNRCLASYNQTKIQRELIPEFTCFADYYDFDITLARIRRPQEKGKVERFVGIFKKSFMPRLSKKTGHDIDELNEKALKWCNEVNAQVHSVTGCTPVSRLEKEGLKLLPPISYYSDNQKHTTPDGTLYFRGFVFHVGREFADADCTVYDLENTIIARFGEHTKVLGRRELPVFIRKTYSRRTYKTEMEKKRAKRKVKTRDLRKYFTELPIEIKKKWGDLCAGFRTAGLSTC